MIASREKGAMVWQLRQWMGGDAIAQAEHALELGLQNVCIKINDGRQERWEGNRTDQNADFLPATVNALQAAGIRVTGWGWTYGGSGSIRFRTFRPNADIARREGELSGELCLRYGMKDYFIDAEVQYHRDGMEPSANAFCEGLKGMAPNVNQLLCSYRFPRTAQPKFPVRTFAPHQNGWAPQVYFLQDNRVDGGAIQLQRSKENHYDLIRQLPYVGVAPTYLHKYRINLQARTWTANKLQLTNFFQRAAAIGCEGISVWRLEEANASQLEAIKEFNWPGSVEPPDPPPDEKVNIEVRVPAGKTDVQVVEVE
ncbi:hypothetical protein LCGC14_0401080 [marine sediment metagenome]|uniref:GH18 domain-containing protein n=1 Tax=marine sediment metagenome TaxID=412755 RepID=A0A0F9SWY7_9ZZZZ